MSLPMGASKECSHVSLQSCQLNMKTFFSNTGFSQDLLGICAYGYLKTEIVFPVGISLSGHSDLKKE